MGRVWILAFLLCTVACAPPPARWFHTRALPDAVRGDPAARLELSQAQSELLSSPAGLQRDGRLAEIALSLSDRDSADGIFDGTRVALLARAHGLVNPLPQVVVVESASLPRARRALVKRGIATANETGSTHFGLCATHRNARWQLVLVLDRRAVVMKPVPATLSRPGVVHFDARLTNGLKDPVVVVTQPDGSVVKPQLQHSSGRVHGDLSLSEGLWGIELIGKGPRGNEVAANMAIAVAVPISQAIDLTSEAPPDTDADDVARQLRTLIALDRARAGLGALSVSAELGRVALAHSLEMRDTRTFGHVSRRTGSSLERVARAGVSAWNLRENLARGYSAREIHALLMLSPAHRAAILSPTVDRLGLGVARHEDQGRSGFYVTELFARGPRPFVIEVALKRLRERLDEARARVNLPPLAWHPSLVHAAQNAAGLYFERPKIQVERLLVESVRAADEPLGTRLLVASLFENMETDAVPISTGVLDADARWVGAGIARGSDSRTGAHGIALAIVIAK